ncbi:MAG: hypothetical protein HN712_24630 [Gemmatimonadetes bacterium]|jgi:hypothetical protein|nr:hypothetical protein [Gemmatimonadota bacterium]MBT6146098.1 hypothetical protein [Gemmatimonadota bacterium]MBT7863525.1 hypothetical protein [Gemmatimonadota bacterium]
MSLRIHVEVEESIATYEPAENGAGPLWCHGSTVIVRHHDEVFAAGLETLPDHVPLNNTRWVLYHRPDSGTWDEIYRDSGRTREPSPIVLLGDDLLVSANPTLAPAGEYGGDAEPTIFRFDTADMEVAPVGELPAWHGEAPFREHSYRSVVADGATGQVLYMQNEGYEIAHLSFLHKDQWSARGVIRWPYSDSGDKPQPLRLCYPNIQLRQGIAHFLGVGDIIEPVEAWREAKKKITGRDWDYVFRRLFYASSQPLPDAADSGEPFGGWLELANRDATAGATRNCDLWVDGQGCVHVMWVEITTDARIRNLFFPGVEVRHSLEHACIVDDAIVGRRTLASWGEGESAPKPLLARFHEISPGRAVILAQFSETDEDERSSTLYRLAALSHELADPVEWIDVPFTRPMAGTFLTSTVRGGSKPSPIIDLVGSINGPALGYARLRVEDEA